MRYVTGCLLIGGLIAGTAFAVPAQAPAGVSTESAGSTAPSSIATPDGVPGPVPQSPPPAINGQERFEPTDKVRADFDVSFPIDI